MGGALYYLLTSFLLKEDIRLNQDELKLQLLSHPSYPSLHSVTGVLDHFGIENMALEVPNNRETLFQLPNYFIALVSNDDVEEFVIITQLENGIELLYGNKKKERVSIDKFLHIWNGIIVAIEKTSSKLPTKKVNSPFLLNSMFFLSAFIVLSVFFFMKPSLFQSTHFIVSLAGIWISFLIIKHEFGFQSKTLEKICTANEVTNCDAVLNSKGASISNYFKLSDISLIYFIGLTISSIFIISFSASTNTIIIVSLLALPITFYSIYYQYNIVKKWCPLCLGIVAVLWLQCYTLFFNQTFISSIKLDSKSSFILFFSFLVTTSIWLFIKPLLKKQQELEKLEIEHHKFKRNFELFNAVYSKGKIIDTRPIDSKEIVLGNKNASLRILIITNPQCFYCKEAHTDLEKVLHRNPDKVAIVIRFNVSPDKDSIATKIANRILEIYNTESEKKCREALHEVYKSDADLNQWLLKYGESSDTTFNNVIEAQRNWCHDNNINFTPAIFINNRPFPKEYNRSDLNYFIEDLIELVEIESAQQPKNLEVVNNIK